MDKNLYTQNKFGAMALRQGTIAYVNFLNELQHAEFFMLSAVIGSDFISKNEEEARNTLIEIYTDKKNKDAKKQVQLLKTIEINQILDVRNYEQFYCQMAYARTVDNLLTYFKDILAEVITAQPNILKSNEIEKLDFILSYETMSDLKLALSEKKIEELFYKGIDKIEEFFLSKLKITLFKSDEEKSGFNRIVKNRNLIVHNRGRVNTQFIKEFASNKYKKNQILKATFKDLSELSISVSNIVAYLDHEISTKYKLKQIKLN
jgi:hypothetical protein